MSAKERKKGARGELELARIFRENGWPNARRTQDGREQAARGDIANGPAGTHIECKFVERLSVPRALDQLERDSDPLDMPILVHRPSRRPWHATVLLEDLLPLLLLRERG